MLKKNLLSLLSLFCVVFIFSFATPANTVDETEPAAISTLTQTKLPSGAVRVLPDSVPAEINQALEKLVETGKGKLVQGDAEVLAWQGANYRKANAASLINQIQNNLRTKGWVYETAGEEDGVTIFSVFQETPTRRAILGFYVASDDVLVVAWTEVLSAQNNQGNNKPATSLPTQQDNQIDIVGVWETGGMSMMADRNRVTGSITPSNGSTMKYVFTANGRFEFVGYMQSTQYGCTTTLFNDKRGKYEIQGSQITLIPNKNFWRKQNSCAPNSDQEKNYTLEQETFELRAKTDEYGKQFICLANAKGETCYRREQE
jgi:hypothetical protein